MIDTGWSLFLDRDGVINTRIHGGYVQRWEQFQFLPGVGDALKILATKFNRIIVVSNQQGIHSGHYDRGRARNTSPENDS